MASPPSHSSLHNSSVDCTSVPSPTHKAASRQRRATNKNLSPTHGLHAVRARKAPLASSTKASRRATAKDSRALTSAAHRHSPNDTSTTSPSTRAAVSNLTVNIDSSNVQNTIENSVGASPSSPPQLSSPSSPPPVSSPSSPLSGGSSVMIRRRSCPPKKLGRFVVADYHETPSPFKRPLRSAASATTSLAKMASSAAMAEISGNSPSYQSEAEASVNSPSAERALDSNNTRPLSPVVLGCHSLSPVSSAIPKHSEVDHDTSGTNTDSARSVLEAGATSHASIARSASLSPTSGASANAVLSPPASRPMSPVADSLLDDGEFSSIWSFIHFQKCSLLVM